MEPKTGSTGGNIRFSTEHSRMRMKSGRASRSWRRDSRISRWNKSLEKLKIPEVESAAGSTGGERRLSTEQSRVRMKSRKGKPELVRDIECFAI